MTNSKNEYYLYGILPSERKKAKNNYKRIVEIIKNIKESIKRLEEEAETTERR